MAELETNDSTDELFDDGTSCDKLPPEFANLKTRRTKLSKMLEQLQELDRGRKSARIDPKKNPAKLPQSAINSLMADSAFATVASIAALENRGSEFLSPLSEVMCGNNPALRADPTARPAEENGCS